MKSEKIFSTFCHKHYIYCSPHMYNHQSFKFKFHTNLYIYIYININIYIFIIYIIYIYIYYDYYILYIEKEWMVQLHVLANFSCFVSYLESSDAMETFYAQLVVQFFFIDTFHTLNLYAIPYTLNVVDHSFYFRVSVSYGQ